MKTSILLYFSGLKFLVVSIVLIVLYPNSGKTQLIAGGLTVVGFATNKAGFFLKKG